MVPSRVTEAKRRIQRALRSRSRQGRDKRRMSVADPSMSNWRDVSSSQDEEEKIEEAEGEGEENTWRRWEEANQLLELSSPFSRSEELKVKVQVNSRGGESTRGKKEEA